jgi:hypothetical protein
MPGKRVQFDQETWRTSTCSPETMRDFQDRRSLRRSDEQAPPARRPQDGVMESVGAIEKRLPAPSVPCRDASRKARRGE